MGKGYFGGVGKGSGQRKCKKHTKSKAIRCCSDVAVALEATTAMTTTTTYVPQVLRNCAALGWTTHFAGKACGESNKGFKIKSNTDKCYNWISQPDGDKQCVRCARCVVFFWYKGCCCPRMLFDPPSAVGLKSEYQDVSAAALTV
jgi:hypothetical protein